MGTDEHGWERTPSRGWKFAQPQSQPLNSSPGWILLIRVYPCPSVVQLRRSGLDSAVGAHETHQTHEMKRRWPIPPAHPPGEGPALATTSPFVCFVGTTAAFRMKASAEERLRILRNLTERAQRLTTERLSYPCPSVVQSRRSDSAETGRAAGIRASATPAAGARRAAPSS